MNVVSVPKLSYEDARICEGELNELEFMKALKSMQNNTSLGNNALRKEFGDAFWNEINKSPFMNFIMEAREKKKLSPSQIKL